MILGSASGLRWRTLTPSLSDLRAYDPARPSGGFRRTTDRGARLTRRAVAESPPIFETKFQTTPEFWYKEAGSRELIVLYLGE